MKRYSTDKKALFVVCIVAIGGWAILMVALAVIPPFDFSSIIRGTLLFCFGSILYLVGTRYTYLLMDNKTFVCKSFLYSRTIPTKEITGFKRLMYLPQPRFFVLYNKGGKEYRANIVSGIFSRYTLGEFAYDLMQHNATVDLDSHAHSLISEYRTNGNGDSHH